MTVNGMILFRPIAMIDPLVMIRLMLICGCFPVVVSRGRIPVAPTELIVRRLM
jgi:hypothetical protein